MAPDVADESVPCIGCDGMAEPEQDGPVTYYACPFCGQEFGHQVGQPDGPLCAAGLPVETAHQPGAGDRSVFLGATISRRPE